MIAAAKRAEGASARGVKLSGGQRQRIALACGILKETPLLALDEATTALDSEVEAAIWEIFYGMMEGNTVIAIAHRLSTIARLDRLLALDESGGHGELLARDGVCSKPWCRHSGGFMSTGTEEVAA